MSAYSKKLKDSRWQKKRLEVLERDGWKCLRCNKGENGGVCLHVHHSYYKKGKDPWEYDSESLSTLCADCHEKEPKSREYFLDQIQKSIILNGFISTHAYEIDCLIANISMIKKTELQELFATLQCVAYEPIMAKMVRAIKTYDWDEFDKLLVEYDKYRAEQEERFIAYQNSIKKEEAAI